MSQIPKDKKPKYNHNEAFRWVDGQWEKFMTEQKELKEKIIKLEEELKVDNDYINNLEGACDAYKKQLESLISRVPSKYLVGSNNEIQPNLSEYEQMELFKEN